MEGLQAKFYFYSRFVLVRNSAALVQLTLAGLEEVTLRQASCGFVM